jgi:colanic acid biosynthesis glycosyl transferase WcaI
MKKKILILNHVFWPDLINTARHISELSEELVDRGWDVTALITNRSYVDSSKKIHPKKGIWKGVKYYRIFIPPLNQKKDIQRLLTAFWITLSWILRIPFLSKYDAIILGTNPPFSYLSLPFIRFFKRKSKIFMWSFDLYPEAIFVSSKKEFEFLKKILKPIINFCYMQLDVIVDIGPCMKNIYDNYNKKVKKVTLPPWSFVEPKAIKDPHEKTRELLFKKSKLTLLYTGTIGNAHEFDLFLELARYLRMKKASVGFCFAGFGNRFEDLKYQVKKDDTNITFAGFVETDKELEERLSSADLMLISLKQNWTGVSVPSKYFSALANGKAVLFLGSTNSALSIWTKEYNLGYVLEKNNVHKIGDMLIDVSGDKNMISNLKKNSFNIYNKKFSKKKVCDDWSELILNTIENGINNSLYK